MGARRVLLHDEHAGAHAPDRELLVPLDRDALHPHLGDIRSARALREEGDQPVDRRRRALGVHGHAAVLGVAHPSEHAEPAGLAPRRFPEADALDRAGDRRSDRPLAARPVRRRASRAWLDGIRSGAHGP
jgi:hypothetical protein